MRPTDYLEMEQESLSEVQKLIRLKRYECPPEEAVDTFLEEFQRRQRSQALTGSSRKLLYERVVTFMSGFGNARWVFAAGGTYAYLMLFALMRPSVAPIGSQPSNAGGLNKVGAQGSVVIEKPVYDPKINQVRPLPTPVPKVRVL